MTTNERSEHYVPVYLNPEHLEVGLAYPAAPDGLPQRHPNDGLTVEVTPNVSPVEAIFAPCPPERTVSTWQTCPHCGDVGERELTDAEYAEALEQYRCEQAEWAKHHGQGQYRNGPPHEWCVVECAATGSTYHWMRCGGTAWTLMQMEGRQRAR